MVGCGGDTVHRCVHILYMECSMILVCGAGGFIGGHLVKRLVQEYGEEHVIAVDIKPIQDWWQTFPCINVDSTDLRDPHLVSDVMSERPEWVINLAADMGGMGFIENNKAACMVSSLINTNLLREIVNRRCVTRYFFASSACVYRADAQGSLTPTGLREDHDVYPAQPEDGYGWEKLFAERMCLAFAADHSVDCRIARFHNVYGPFGTWDGGREKAPAAICRKVAEAIIFERSTIRVWGDGKQVRSFVYIDDCIEGIMRMLYSSSQEILNIGSDESVTIDELISLVENAAGLAPGYLHRDHELNSPQGVRGRNSDNTKINKILKWSPQTRLCVGIAETFDYVAEELRRSQRAKR